jgi:putative NADPH-quinone reductase
MGRRICILQGHPDPAGGHLLHAFADAYAAGAQGFGHATRRVEVARLDFPLMRTQDEFVNGAVPPSLLPAQDDLRWAEHWLILFPLWHGSMPALLKGFIEQVMRPGFALAYAEHGFPKRLLAGRTARLVVTMGMPAFVYRFWFGAHGVRALKRSVLNLGGISPVRTNLFGSVDSASVARRSAWIASLREMGARGV